MGIKIVIYQPRDIDEVAALFYQTVHIINAKDYTPKQLDAWAPKKYSKELLNKSLLSDFSLVAKIDGKIVGFGDVYPDKGYINHLYVHKDYQGQKIGTTLCKDLEGLVIPSKVILHSSLTAKSFFEQNGYSLVNKQVVDRRGVKLLNCVMQKNLD